MGVMDSGYPSLRPPAPSAPPVVPTTTPGPPVDDPFGRRPRKESPARDLRKRIGSALAAAAALIDDDDRLPECLGELVGGDARGEHGLQIHNFSSAY